MSWPISPDVRHEQARWMTGFRGGAASGDGRGDPEVERFLVEAGGGGRRHRALAPRARDHVGEGERLQVLAHVLADVGPYRQQHALALVVAGPVLVGLAEVAG